MEGHDFSLVAFVYMPEHVHLLVYPRNAACEVQDLLYAVKRPYAYQIRERLIEVP